MTDYAKKTVAELQEILKSRSLTHTGKKAELVARLNESDASASAEVEADEAPVEPEIIAEPVQQPTTSKPVDPVEAPAAPAPPAPSTDPEATTVSVPDSAATTTDAVPSTFTANLSTTTLESELEKRKARAARFGASNDASAEDANPTEDSSITEAEKAAARASRFGVPADQTSVVKGLNEALPERRERGHNSSRSGGGRGGRGGVSRGPGGGGGGDRRRRGNTPRTGEKGQVQKGGQTTYTSDRDRLAAENRKKRFAA